MPSIAELTAPYGDFMLGPRHGPGVCRTCFNLTDGYDRCYACTDTARSLDAMVPISYSVGHEQLHHVLATYKRSHGLIAYRLQVELAAVISRYLERHEPCLARAAKTGHFDTVTTVPSSLHFRDDIHPLHHIVAELVEPARARYARLLRRSGTPNASHSFSSDKYEPVIDMTEHSVLLIDDTWTTGANAQSAAGALKAVGATTVATLVVGRHINRDHGQNDRRLTSLPVPFDWDRCAFCRPENSVSEQASTLRLASGGRG
jgi:predicted amidophosphoribosyltransferase